MPRPVAFAVLLAVLTIACSEPPTKERQQAAEAIAAARAANADIYAPDELQAAEAALQKYEGSVAQRDYREALNFALDARDRAYAAAKHAAEEKLAAQTRANVLVAEVESLIKAANARLSNPGAPGPRLSAPAAERLRAAVRAATPALQEARSRVDQQDYRSAVLRLTPVVEAIRRELPADPTSGRRGR